jgi:hypothetical protein
MTGLYGSLTEDYANPIKEFIPGIDRSTATPRSDLTKSTTPFAWFNTPVRASRLIVPWHSLRSCLRLKDPIKNCYCHPFCPTTKSMESSLDSRRKRQPSLLSGSQFIKATHGIKGVSAISSVEQRLYSRRPRSFLHLKPPPMNYPRPNVTEVQDQAERGKEILCRAERAWQGEPLPE